MSEPKPQLDARPYAVDDAINPGDVPRVIIHRSQAAAVAHVTNGRFSARPLNAMEVLTLSHQGARIEDPLHTMPAPAAASIPPQSTGASLPLDLGPYPVDQQPPSGDLLAALAADDSAPAPVPSQL